MKNSQEWYGALIKPEWAPPAWLFGPVWSVLYVIIAISFGTVFYKIWTKEIPWIVGVPFALNLVCNLAFTPIQFGLRSNFLAAIDILLVLSTIVWATVLIYPHIKWVAFAQIPYILWVLFATILQLTVTYLNA
jgi:tryptophan-rich sensory protein